MYVISVYDIGEKRVVKMLKLMRRYLHWQQRSVFEGELSEGQIEELLERCRAIMNEEEDSVVLYVLSSDKYIERRMLGKAEDFDGRNFI
jgi:CRISPR-associated protein Cas2